MDAKKIIMYLSDSCSSFGLHEAMMAARDLEDTVFPDLHIEQEFLKLAKEA